MALLHLKIVSPQRVLVDAEVSEVVCPTSLGEIGILPGHMPLVSDIVPGELKLVHNGAVQYFHVSGGVVEIMSGNKVVVLADAAEHPAEIDLEEAELAKERARKALSEAVTSDEEYATVAGNLERSLSRIKTARKHKQRGGQRIDESAL